MCIPGRLTSGGFARRSSRPLMVHWQAAGRWRSRDRPAPPQGKLLGAEGRDVEGGVDLPRRTSRCGESSAAPIQTKLGVPLRDQHSLLAFPTQL